MILVAGATGELGGRTVRVLRSGGRDVRCLVRAGSDAAALEEAGAEVVRGDLLDPGTLTAACAGVGCVVCTATAMARELAGAGARIDRVDDAGVGNLVAAAEVA